MEVWLGVVWGLVSGLVGSVGWGAEGAEWWVSLGGPGAFQVAVGLQCAIKMTRDSDKMDPCTAVARLALCASFPL